MLTLLTLASRQIWPQVLSVLHLAPRLRRLVLFHSSEASESQRPAERLRQFFVDTQLLRADAIELCLVPHDRFGEIVDAIGSVAERLLLDDTNCQLHLTGGTKLMAMAAAEWCRLAGVPCFYLERDLRVFAFRPKDLNLIPEPPYPLDPHLARDLEPLALLRCQLDAAEIDAPGQRLSLSARGRDLPESEFGRLLKQDYDFRKLLDWDRPDAAPQHQPGFDLEYATAFVLLKLGVPVVQRSVHLRPRGQPVGRLEEGELDLVFNWAGKLWLVDCKDRKGAAERIEAIRSEILGLTVVTPHLDELLRKLEEELRHRALGPLKEDLLAISETGGLLGRAICVRRAELPPPALDFARSRRLDVVMKHQLFPGFRMLLFPRNQ